MAPASAPGERVLDDDELVARARAGDPHAFATLVCRHQRAALRVAAVISGTTEEASDIVQEAMIKVYVGLDSYRARGTVRSWLLRIVANEAKNQVRGRVRRRRRDDHHSALQIRTSPPADADVVSDDARTRLAEALARLSVRDREVLGCRFVADLSEQTTSQVLGVPVGTVKSRTARALDRLRNALEAT